MPQAKIILEILQWLDACPGDGDGCVPHISSCCYWNSVQTLVLEDAFWYKDYSHGFVLKDERVQRLVNRFLFRGRRFDWRIPSGSIKRVKGLKRETDPEKNLPRWRIETE